jgi:cytochrome b561
MSMQDEPGYPRPSRWLHWLSALIVLALIAIGLTMLRIGDGATKNQLYELHKSFGMIVFVLAALRVATRLVLGAPPPYAGLTRAQRIASTATHHLLYLLLFAMPVLGFVGTSMCCAPVHLFGTFAVPFRFEGTEETVKTVLWLHGMGGFAMAGLIGLHIAGALYHLVLRRDGVMARMSLFGR